MAEMTSSSLTSSLAPTNEVSRRSMRMLRLSSALPRRALTSFWRSSVVTVRKSMLGSPFASGWRTGERRQFTQFGGLLLHQLREDQEHRALQVRLARINGDQLATPLPIIPHRAAF